MSRLVLLSSAVASMLALAAPLSAQVIDTRLAENRAAVTIPSFGQTFTAPAGVARLDRFTFYLYSNAEGAATVSFTAFLYAWDGARATGGPLYSSGLRQAAACCAPVAETFESNVAVTAGAQYVAFIVPTNGSIAAMHPSVGGAFTDSYGGGRFTFTTCGDAPTSCNWFFSQTVPGLDAEFRAEFSTENGVARVPEPSPVPLLAAGLVLLVLVRARRRTW